MASLERAPAPVALVDDNVHSARLFLRTVAARGRRARWIGNGSRGSRTLEAIFASDAEQAPQVIVVDLKERTGASEDFIARLRPLAEANGSILVAMVPSLEKDQRTGALNAGAAAVFQRHADRAEYHREIGALIDFWEANCRLISP